MEPFVIEPPEIVPLLPLTKSIPPHEVPPPVNVTSVALSIPLTTRDVPDFIRNSTSSQYQVLSEGRVKSASVRLYTGPSCIDKKNPTSLAASMQLVSDPHTTSRLYGTSQSLSEK